MAPSVPSSSPTPDAATKRSSYRGAVTVIDDEENMCRILTRFLNLEGYSVSTFTDPREAVAHIEREPPDVVLTDIKMPHLTGEQVLKRVQELDSDIAVVIITAYGTIQGAVEALKRGAYDYITKPFQMDDILLTVARALETRRLRQENRLLSDTLGRSAATSSELVGQSTEMAEVRRLIEKIAPSDSAVLIVGESGTGKELVARAIHRLSPRADQRFVPINCASIPEHLLESELFGYERGAFTGANRTKMGLMELASGGTLFLDEIGDLPVALQAKLLRSLQEREIQRVGGLRNIAIDIRLLAATNRDLLKAIEDEQFRRDLYYRLNVLSIVLPPLRKRPGDIANLARFFVNRYAAKRGRNITITDRALHTLEQYHWPGNVRELENIIERTVVLLDGDAIDDIDLPADLAGIGSVRLAGVTPTPAPPASHREPEPMTHAARELVDSAIDYREARDRFEREYLRQILLQCGASVTEAARRTGMSRRNLYEKFEKLGLSLDQIKESERANGPTDPPARKETPI